MTRWIGRTRSAARLRMAVVACALLIPVIPALAGCEAGLDAPTLNFHSAASGASKQAGDVLISNAFVLGPDVGQTLPAGQNAGLFLSVFSTGGDELESVTAPGTAGSVNIVNGPVTVTPGQPANLTGPAPEIVLQNLSAPLSGGQTVNVTLTFSKAGAVSFQVPVVPHAFEYATFAPAG